MQEPCYEIIMENIQWFYKHDWHINTNSKYLLQRIFNFNYVINLLYMFILLNVRSLPDTINLCPLKQNSNIRYVIYVMYFLTLYFSSSPPSMNQGITSLINSWHFIPFPPPKKNPYRSTIFSLLLVSSPRVFIRHFAHHFTYRFISPQNVPGIRLIWGKFCGPACSNLGEPLNRYLRLSRLIVHIFRNHLTSSHPLSFINFPSE